MVSFNPIESLELSQPVASVTSLQIWPFVRAIDIEMGDPSVNLPRIGNPGGTVSGPSKSDTKVTVATPATLAKIATSLMRVCATSS